MEEAKQHSNKLFFSYLMLIGAILTWAGAWAFPIVAAEWISLTNCSGLCGAVTLAYSSVLFKALVISVLLLVVVKELLITGQSIKLKLNLGIFVLGLLVTAVFLVSLSLPLLSAAPV